MKAKQKVFLSAGIRGDHEPVFFTNHSNYKHGDTIFHRNFFSTIYTIPWEFYKKHFKFDYSMYKYQTTLKHGDIKQFAEIIEHDDNY